MNVGAAYLTDEEVGARIKGLLGQRKQAEVARAAGMDETALSKVLKGTRKLTLGELARIASVLSIDPGDLLMREVEARPMWRSDADPAAVGEAERAMSRAIDAYLLFDALVPAGS